MPGEPPFAYSLLFTRSEAGDETRLLVEVQGKRYELVSTQDPTGRDSTESVRALGVEETLSRRLVLGAAATKAGCPPSQLPDGCVVLKGARGTVAAPLTAFSGKDADALRARARAVLGPELAQRIQDLAPLFGRSVEFDAYAEDFLGLLWPEAFGTRRTSAVKGTRTAGCAFDAAFGYPCSEAEKKREGVRFGTR